MDSLVTLQAMGLTLPSPAYLLGSALFGLLGYAAHLGRRGAHGVSGGGGRHAAALAGGRGPERFPGFALEVSRLALRAATWFTILP